ncbi:MAG: tetratricopeptide repeat protein [Candidatus Lindowbacteria bacterium]|nr:tetratricopeptide repeat protein [Candidatus Lindowbacteria bacterium]
MDCKPCNNASVHGFSSFPRFFSADFWSESTQPVARGYYRPLILLSYAIDYSLWGLRPAGFHLTNILWHALASALVVVLVLRIISSPTAALLSGALFAVHPVHVESVTFVSGRTDVIATVFALISFILFVDERCEERITWRLPVSVLFFVLALLSKEVAAALPALLLAAEMVFGSRGAARTNEFAPKPNRDPRPGTAKGFPPAGLKIIVIHGIYWGVLGLYLWTRFGALGISPKLEGRLTGREVLLTMPGVLLDYMRLLIAPIALCADYVVNLQRDVSLANIASLAVALVGCGAIGYLILQRKISGLLAAWVLTGLLPALQIVPISVLKAERFLYFPSVGFCALAGFLGACAAGKPAKHESGAGGHGRALLRIFAFILIILALSFRTFTRNNVWKDEFTLYKATASCAPDNFRVQYNLGNAYFRKGDIENAIAHTETAFRLRPDFPQVSYNLGLMYATVGRVKEAEIMYRRAIDLDPAYARAHNNLAVILYADGRIEEARSEWSKALVLDHALEQAREGLRLIEKVRK